MDASGNFLSGSYIAPDGTTITATGGSVALDQKGVMSGSFTVDTGDTITVVHGKLDQSKTKAAFVTVATDGSMDIGYFFKSGGTFAASDLEGTWYAYTTVIDATTGGVYWAHGTLDVDGSGKVTGTFNLPDGSTASVTDGTLNLSNKGIVTGNTTVSLGDTSSTSTIVHGKLDQGKTLGVYVALSADGSMRIGHMVKAGGTFKQGDGAGNWYVYGLSIDPSIPAVFWLYGDDASVDASGNITGSFTPPMGDSIGGAGTASIDSNGVIFGEFAFDTGDAGVGYFKMDQGKTIIDGVTVTASGAMAMWQYIKASPVALPGLPLLLLED
jgi:hypothetical protein